MKTRSNFLFLPFLFLAASLSAQTRGATDEGRAFGEGRLLLVPGGWTYAGDTAYAPKVVEVPEGWRTLPGLAAFLPAWSDILTSSTMGLRRNPPAVLFEEMICPLGEATAFLPVGGMGSVEFLDFPAGAWWGPSAGAGAIHLQAPSPQPHRSASATTWASGSDAGGSLAGKLDHAAARMSWNSRKAALGDRDNELSGSMVAEVPVTDSWTFGLSGLHASRDGADWDAVQFPLGWSSGVFQDVRVVPYVQRARLGVMKGTEWGLRLEHHFNMAGVLETHWGAGASDHERSGGPGVGGKKAGYLRTGFFVDALGRVNLDAMFRLDGQEGAHAAPSAMSGFRLPLDPFVVEMGFHRSAWWAEDFVTAVTTRGRCAENFAGLRFQPGLSWRLALRAVRDSGGSGPSYGLLPSALWEKRLPAGFPVRSLKLEGIGDWRKEAGTSSERSSGLWARATLGLRTGVLLWGACRAQRNSSGLASFGASWKGNRLAARLDLENAGDAPVAWPEPGVESGRTVRGSLEAFL